MLFSRTHQQSKQEGKKSKFGSNNSKVGMSIYAQQSRKSRELSQQLNELSTQQLKVYKLRKQLMQDISHPRIRELIYSHSSPQKLLTSKRQKQKQQHKNNLINLQLLQQRKWLTKKGKKYLIDFDDHQRKQMKNCFNSMDDKHEGSIGIDQLEELLLSVGLMQTREQVKELIDSVDEDKSGKIQFSQFLKMIQNDQGENQEIVSFFKYIINGNKQKDTLQIIPTKVQTKQKLDSPRNSKRIALMKKLSLMTQKQGTQNIKQSRFFDKQNKGQLCVNKRKGSNQCQKSVNSTLAIFEQHPHPKNLPFGMIISHIRRKHMMTALKIGSPVLSKNHSSLFEPQKTFQEINTIRSIQNFKQSTNFKKIIYKEEDVSKGQNVMNALKRMWDRRLLRQIRENRRDTTCNMNRLSQAQNLPNLRV